MKILFTTENYIPNISGVPVVVKYLAEGLVNKGHDVYLATRLLKNTNPMDEYNNVKVKRFNIKYDAFKKVRGDIKEYRNFALKSGFDVIILECAQCCTTDALLPVLKDFNGIKILHSHGFSGLEIIPFKLKATLKHTIGNTVNYFIWNDYYNYILP